MIIHDYNEYKEAVCYIYFSDTATFLFHSSIKSDPYLYNFLKSFVNEVNLTFNKMEDLK